MARPATHAESHPPVVPATPAVAAAITAYHDACVAAADMAAHAPGSTRDWEASRQAEAARRELERLLLGLARTEGRAWHAMPDGSAWGVAKRSKRGLELTRRDATDITPTRR